MIKPLISNQLYKLVLIMLTFWDVQTFDFKILKNHLGFACSMPGKSSKHIIPNGYESGGIKQNSRRQNTTNLQDSGPLTSNCCKWMYP